MVGWLGTGCYEVFVGDFDLLAWVVCCAPCKVVVVYVWCWCFLELVLVGWGYVVCVYLVLSVCEVELGLSDCYLMCFV